jgi:2-keto-4-pentenoate hydratase/2-oxohepta-3-ene-1,7-dioic acid hydratase in catechol pathway
VGSDHTDRKAEAAGIALSKQLCGKPVGTQLWRYEEVEAHWDWLMLRAYATIDGVRTLYQESEVASLRTPRDLIRKHTGTYTLPVGTAMYCGTPAAIGGIRPATRFEMELEDPVLGRTLRHAYDVEVLPVVS